MERPASHQVCGGRWYDHVEGRPAYRHLDPERLAAAVAPGVRLRREGEPLLRRLDEDSLRWRGKAPRAGRAPTRGAVATRTRGAAT